MKHDFYYADFRNAHDHSINRCVRSVYRPVSQSDKNLNYMVKLLFTSEVNHSFHCTNFHKTQDY